MLVRGGGRGIFYYEVALEVAGFMDWTGRASSHRMSCPTWMGHSSKSSQSPRHGLGKPLGWSLAVPGKVRGPSSLPKVVCLGICCEHHSSTNQTELFRTRRVSCVCFSCHFFLFMFLV